MEKYNKNLGYYYLKQRFESYYFNDEMLDRLDNEFFSVDILKEKENELDINGKLKKIYLTVGYPGLLIGTGTKLEFIPLDDDDKKERDNYKIGINFDYTSGLPIIHGSSIKGVLKSFFPNSIDSEEIREAKTAIINEILEKEFSVEDIEEIISKSIFEGSIGERNLPIYKRDKFIEGRILVEKKPVLEKDYITPHKKEKLNPLELLKIAPKTKIEIILELHDLEIAGIKITADEKLKLFKEILYIVGLGAKTNTGYGHFDVELGKEFESKKIREELAREKAQKELEELKKIEEKRKAREALSPIERWKEEFNEKSDEQKKNYKEDLEKFQGDERKIVAEAYLEFFKLDKKPSKKTKEKIKELETIILNS